MTADTPWSVEATLADVARGPIERRLVADEAARGAIARALGLDRLDRLEAEVRLAPWLDGVRIDARWSAEVEQTCGVTLEPFTSTLEGRFTVTVLPKGSPNAAEPAGKEVTIDLEDEDPPDLAEGDRFDLGAYVVEHLALEIDPFPRKPGAVFEPPPAEEPESPFAALRALAPKPKDG